MPRIIVIGAGLAGLVAAQALQQRCQVTLLEQAQDVGGRLATRHVGEAAFDIGAQFFTAKSDRFADEVTGWRAAGVAGEWFSGPPDDPEPAPLLGPDPHPRFRGIPAMQVVADHLASGLDVRAGRRVTQVRSSSGGWRVTSVARGNPAATDELVADGLLCTAPVPETLTQLDAGGVVLSPGLRRQLETIVYEPTLTVMVVPQGEPDLGSRGALRFTQGPLAFLSDNRAKGVSPVPAVTIHASGAFSRRQWGDGDEAIAGKLLAAARPWLGDGAEVVGVHRWRYATPLHEPPTDGWPAMVDAAPLPVAFAGDAFSGGRVEGAARSGWAAAELLAETLR